MTLHPDIERVALIGWHLYPASSGSKAACFKGATDRATCHLDTLEAWSNQFPGCNWRVVCGPSRVWGLDCDVPPGHAHDGVAGLAELTRSNGALPPRPQLRSGGGGIALFFRHLDERITGEAGRPALGIDPRRGRQSQTIPPSIHIVTRKPYRWLTAPWELAPPPAPAWLLQLVAPPPDPVMPDPPVGSAGTPEGRRRYALAALRHAGERVSVACPGMRNDTLNRATFSLTRFITEGVLDASEIALTLAYAARQAGLNATEVRGTLTSALAAGARR